MRPLNPADPTTDYVPDLVRHGACICWSPRFLRVPIPLIDLRFQSDRCFTWATIQTPFGSQEPLFGMVVYAKQNRDGESATFWDADDNFLCAIHQNAVFGFPKYTEAKLNKKAQEHHERLRTDSGYAKLWEHHFLIGVALCVEAGQLPPRPR